MEPGKWKIIPDYGTTQPYFSSFKKSLANNLPTYQWILLFYPELYQKLSQNGN